jgi:hypothetical protein
VQLHGSIADPNSMAARTEASAEVPPEISLCRISILFSRLHWSQGPYSYGVINSLAPNSMLGTWEFRSAIIAGAADDQHCFCRANYRA